MTDNTELDRARIDLAQAVEEATSIAHSGMSITQFVEAFARLIAREEIARSEPSRASGGGGGIGGETLASCAQWADETFGPATALRRIERAEEEIEEAKTAPAEKLLEEIADAVICLAAAAHSAGGDLHSAINDKMKVNRKRKWALRGDGTGYHVPSPSSEPAQATEGEDDDLATRIWDEWAHDRDGCIDAIRQALTTAHQSAAHFYTEMDRAWNEANKNEEALRTANARIAELERKLKCVHFNHETTKNALVEAEKDAAENLAMAVAAAASLADIRELLDDIKTWANSRCPCENDLPNPCPLCGADANKASDICLAAENTVPKRLLARIDRALLTPSPTARGTDTTPTEKGASPCTQDQFPETSATDGSPQSRRPLPSNADSAARMMSGTEVGRVATEPTTISNTNAEDASAHGGSKALMPDAQPALGTDTPAPAPDMSGVAKALRAMQSRATTTIEHYRDFPPNQSAALAGWEELRTEINAALAPLQGGTDVKAL